MPKSESTKPVIIFILSWNRPIYLWVCLDSIYRHTRYPCKVIIADNNSSDPLVNRVIVGFEKRGLFHAVHLCKENDPFRFKKLIEQYWEQIDEYFVFVEGDIEILPVEPCWLTKFVSYMNADSQLGSVGSRVYQPDFVDPETARGLMPDLQQKELDFLIKSEAPMRKYKHTTQPLICPHNAPLRLMIMRKKAYQQVGFGRDFQIHSRLIDAGFKAMISTEVAHRHLSLLNIFDYENYSGNERDWFFAPQLER